MLRNRSGVGLIEVIVCTALVAVMVIPIAGVIRSSGQSLARANGSPKTESDLRRGLRWVSDTIRGGQVLSVRSGRLQLQLGSGSVGTIRVRRGNLVLEDGTTTIVLLENVRDVQFSEVAQLVPPNARVGVAMTLRANDPETGSLVGVTASVAIAPQI